MNFPVAVLNTVAAAFLEKKLKRIDVLQGPL